MGRPRVARGVVYKVTCRTTGMCYVGSTTKTLASRKLGHKNDIARGSKSRLSQAVSVYGWEDFVWEVLEQHDDPEALRAAEEKWILVLDSHNNGYNRTRSGQGGKEPGDSYAVGYTMSKEARENISVARLGNKNALGKSWSLSEETRERMRAAVTAEWESGRKLLPARGKNGRFVSKGAAQ